MSATGPLAIPSAEESTGPRCKPSRRIPNLRSVHVSSTWVPVRPSPQPPWFRSSFRVASIPIDADPIPRRTTPGTRGAGERYAMRAFMVPRFAVSGALRNGPTHTARLSPGPRSVSATRDNANSALVALNERIARFVLRVMAIPFFGVKRATRCSAAAGKARPRPAEAAPDPEGR